MAKRRLMRITALLALALLLPVTPALADDGPPDGDGITIWNEDYTVEAGDTVEDDLTVFNGDLTVEAGGTVEGAVVVLNGNATIEGDVEGDLTVVGGDIYLGENAWVEGDVVCSWNCDLDQEAGAKVEGSIIEGAFPEWQRFPVSPPHPMNIRFPEADAVFDPLMTFVRNVLSAFVVAAIAVLLTLLLPPQTARVGQTMVKAIWPSLGYGVLTAFAAGTTIVLLALTICFAPIAIVAGIVLLAAGLYGWICFGAVVGQRLLKAFKAQDVPPVLAAGLGTLITSLVVALIDTGANLVCCLAPLVWTTVFALGCASLGAVVLTRFGTQSYPSTSAPDETEDN
ncbi:MAG: polymer-forming cytoskeletal protein [Anaerolineae bacterium]|nr:polymer-forming cytoskeletal protein [Anaerolineae bacterium]